MPAVAPPAEVAPDPDEATRISRESFAEEEGAVGRTPQDELGMAVISPEEVAETIRVEREKRRAAEQQILDAGGWDGDPESGYTRTLGDGDVRRRQKVFREGDGWALREMVKKAGAQTGGCYLAGYTLTATLDIAEERRGSAPVAS